MTLPQRPTGTHPLVTCVCKLIDCLRELRLKDSPDLEISRGPDGTLIRVKAKPGKGGSTSNDKPVWL